MNEKVYDLKEKNMHLKYENDSLVTDKIKIKQEVLTVLVYSVYCKTILNIASRMRSMGNTT